VEVGDPVERIVAMAGERHADMILIGNRGKGGMVKMLKGHTTENVIGRAPCAVLVVTA
jgi:nucleotide-binding universal stress UspA family protein